MKLFFREHLPLIFINIIQIILVLTIVYLDGYTNIPTAIYCLFITIFLLSMYLIYRYLTHKEYYKRLTATSYELTDAVQQLGNAPIPEALTNLLKSQYSQYINELHLQENKRANHLTFINQWVHQMKTPLSVMELITQDSDDENLRSIREEAEKISRGLEMVLYAARLETFEHDFQVEPVSMKKVIDDAIRENKRLFISNRVYPEIHGETIIVESDEKWLVFIMNQLITNAVKYSTGKAQKMIVSIQENSIKVQDFGIGIPASDRKRVFHPFFTGENGRQYRESTGMGLYLVKEVCEKLGHQVEVESEIEKGTTVMITF